MAEDPPVVFRRPATAWFGRAILLAAGVVWLTVVFDFSLPASEPVAAGLAMGSICFVVFRGAVWPAVLLHRSRIEVRNPLVTVVVAADRVELGTDAHGAAVLTAHGQDIHLFGFSSSLFLLVFGDRSLWALCSAVENWPGSTGGHGVWRDRWSVVRQFGQLHLVLLGFTVLVRALA